MTPYFANIIETLDHLDWLNLDNAFKGVESLLHDINVTREFLKKEFESTEQKELESRIELSHETNTHYKWFLFKNRQIGYSIWLHEYKDKNLRRAGYAEVPHDHRYWFSSLILKGGYLNSIYKVDREHLDSGTYKKLELIENRFDKANTIYTMNPSTIHSLSELEEPTLTMIIRSKAARQFSESYSLQANRINRYYPFSSRIDNFKTIIAQL